MPHADPAERSRIAKEAVAAREKRRNAPAPPPTDPALQLDSIADYDRLLGRPANWGDAKRREEVQGEIIANERRRDDAALARGKLFSREQVLARDEKRDAAVLEHLQEITEAMVKLLPLEAQPDGRRKAQEVLAAFRSATAARLKGIS